MKLSDNQKKWALTASLATVLSFNLIMTLGASPVGAATMASSVDKTILDSKDARIAAKNLSERRKYEASEKAEQEANRQPADEDRDRLYADFDTKDGVQKVMFEKNGDKTMASIASGTCYTCGEHINLPVEFSQNISDLKVALRKAQADSPKSASSEVSKADDSKVPKTRKEREKLRKTGDDEDSSDEGKLALDKLAKECRDKSHYKKADDRLECFSDGLVSTLSADDIEFKQTDVYRLFANEIAKPLMEMMKSAQGTARRDTAKSIINDLASSLPEDYNYLRQALAKVNAKIVADAERDVQAKVNEYKQIDQIAKANPSNTALRQQANSVAESINQSQGRAEQLANDLGANLQAGYYDAVSNQYMTTDLANQYLKVDYAGTVNSIIQGLKTSTMNYMAGNVNASNYQIPAIDISNGTAVTLADGSTLLITTASNTVGANSVITTNSNGVRVTANGLTPQSVLQASTPMIAPNANGQQNTVRITVVPAGQAGVQNNANRTMPSIGVNR